MDAQHSKITKKTDLLTAKECAQYLGISESYFHKLRKKLALPYYSFGQEDRRYYVGAEVDAYLHKIGRHNPTPML